MPSRPSLLEPLEARIAPALALQNPLPDLIAGPGRAGAVVDLSEIFDPAATSPNRTIVEFTTNFDTDASAAGVQAGVIRLELFDELAPLTVQNFLSYVNSRNARGDYDGTFFHRAGALSPGSTAREVLQGGGFELSAKGQPFHITTGLPVHNEYRDDTPNARGTISMAKTGLGPNTGTSEFFINLTDNSSALGAGNNGGFAVFGRIEDASLAIIDAIGNSPTRAVVGSFGAPVQNVTGTGAPAADQLIRITSARVIPPDSGDATGITFSIENIFQAGTTTPSDVLTGRIIGTSLNLRYKPGAVGEVDVVVRAVGPGGASDTASDVFKVTVQPNLITSLVSDPLPGFLTPGDAATVRLELSNSGGGIARGRVDVRFFLAEISTFTGELITGGARIEIGEVQDRAIAIAGGGSAVLAARVRVPLELLSNINRTYRLIAEVEPVGALAGQELFSDDNVALEGGNHRVLNQFGGFNERTNVPLTFLESDGDRVTLTLAGAGVGSLTPDSAGKIDLALSNTTALSRLSARVIKGAGGDGRFDLNDINLNSVLNSAALGLADVDGFVAASGGLRVLQLGDLTGPGSLSIGAFLPANTASATIRLGRVSDYSFESLMPVASLTAIEWLDIGALDEKLSLLSLGTLNITGARNTARGDLQTSVEITGSAAVRAIRVAGLLSDAAITTAGDIGAIVLGGIDGSSVFAGTTARPAALADFLAERTISTFVIRGIPGFTGDLFVDSQVAAQNFGAITVQKVAPANGGTAFGFVADAVRSYNRIGGDRLARLDAPASLDGATDYRLAIL